MRSRSGALANGKVRVPTQFSMVGLLLVIDRLASPTRIHITPPFSHITPSISFVVSQFLEHVEDTTIGISLPRQQRVLVSAEREKEFCT